MNADVPTIEGLYHTCGRRNWLVVQEWPAPGLPAPPRTSGSAIGTLPFSGWDSNTQFGRQIYPEIVTASRSGAEPDPHLAHSFVFLRPRSNTADAAARTKTALDMLERLGDTCSSAGIAVASVVLLHGWDWWLVAEVTSPNFRDLYPLTRELDAAGIATLTKLVLTPHKHRHIKRSIPTVVPTTKSLEGELLLTAIARQDEDLLANQDEFQRERIKAVFDRANLPAPESPFLDEARPRVYEHRTSSLRPSKYARCVAIQPASPQWVVNYAFLRARRASPYASRSTPSPGELRAQLKKRIGIHLSSAEGSDAFLLRHFWEITGEYDILAPLWTYRSTPVEKVIDWLSDLPIDTTPRIIRGLIASGSRMMRGGRVPKAVSDAFLRNASNASRDLADLRRLNDAGDWKKIDDPSARMRILHETTKAIDEAEVDMMLPDLNEVSNLGMKRVWDLDIEKLSAAFLRLKPRHEKSYELRRLVGKLTGAGDEPTYEFIFDFYGTDHRELVGLAFYSDPGELERFLEKTRSYCEHSEFHAILSEESSWPRIEMAQRCQPCTNPVAETSRQHWKWVRPDCRQCGLYTRRPEDPDLPRPRIVVDLRSEASETELAQSLESVKIASLGFDLTFRHQLFLGVLDGMIDENMSEEGTSEERTLRVQDSARKLLQYLEQKDPIRALLSDFCRQSASALATDRVHYKEYLKRLANRKATKEAQVLVLPEYAVPEYCLRALVELLCRQTGDSNAPQKFAVLGSHIDSHRQNAAPILFARGGEGKLFWQPKMYPSEYEERNAERMRLSWGKMPFLFRTDFGNILTRVCADVRGDWPHHDVDIVAIPTYHWGSKESFMGRIAGPKKNFRVVAMAQGASAHAMGSAKSNPSIERMPSEVICDLQKAVTYKKSQQLRGNTEFTGETVDPVSCDFECKTIDLLRLDRERATSRADSSCIPVHPDLWQAQERDADQLKASLEKARNLTDARFGPRLSDHFVLDWVEAANTTAGRGNDPRIEKVP